MGQRARLHRMFIVFRPNSIVSATEMAFFFLKIFILVIFFPASEFRFVQICEAFQLEMGQRPSVHQRFFIFQPNSIVSGRKWHFFWKFLFQCLFFLASEFRFTQICEAFQLEKGQRPRVHQRFIVFCQIPSFRPPKWHFFENLRFGAQFFYFIFAPKFKFTQIGATFRLEIG